MGNKALIRLTILLAVVGVVALIVKLAGVGTVDRGGSAASDPSDRELVLENLSLNDVARVRIKSAEGELNLIRGERNWQVAERGNHPANGETVANLLRSAGRLKIRQRPVFDPASFGSVHLLDPAKLENLPGETALIVSFLNSEGKELDALWLGKPYEKADSRPSPFGGPSSNEAGRYVKTGGENEVFLVEETFEEVKTDPAEWLNEEFFKVEKTQSIAFKSGDPADDWKLERKEATGDFTLADAKADEELDSIKVSPMKTAFQSPRFEDVAVGDEAKDNKPEKNTFEITTFEGFNYTVTVGEKNDLNELYLTFTVDGKFPEKREPGLEESEEEAKAADEQFAGNLKRLQTKLAAEKALAGKIYKVRSYLVDSITKKRSELLKKKEEIAPGLKSLPGVPGGGPLNLTPPAPAPAPTPKPEAIPEKPAAPAPQKADEPKVEKPKAKGKGKADDASKAKPNPNPKAEAKPKPEPKSESPEGAKGDGAEPAKKDGE